MAISLREMIFVTAGLRTVPPVLLSLFGDSKRLPTAHWTWDGRPSLGHAAGQQRFSSHLKLRRGA